ncbi:MAG: UDP-N-acetylmuramoyl-L-alanine--D-glutamate ligase [Actinomycetota bacterium]
MTVTSFGLKDGTSLRGCRVVVLGLARSGEAAIGLLSSCGAQVRVLDGVDDEQRRSLATSLGVEAVFGRTEADDIGGADLIVTSPGIKPSSVWRMAAEQAGVPIWSEIELAWRAGIRPLAAITGTNGKTTATRMLAEALNAAGVPATAAGNIGLPLAACRPGQPIVAEVSSFQLDTIDAFTAPVAVLLNLAPDHLDWHGSMDAYAAAKQRLFRNLTPEDRAIAHVDCVSHASVGPASVEAFDTTEPEGVQTLGVRDGQLVVADRRILAVSDLNSSYKPFVLDALAAAGAALRLGADLARVADALASFKPDPHRLETIAEIDGVVFVNDSKATDPHATATALEAFPGPVILIAGGLNKGLSFEDVVNASGRVRWVIAMGDAASEIAEAFAATGIEIQIRPELEDAVNEAARQAAPGDTVLLSPACASFDRFSSYEERGQRFTEQVLRIQESR